MAGQWTVPWGRLEPGESPGAAAIRETAEEGGVTVEVEGFLGIQELSKRWTGWIALAFQCRHVEGEPKPDGLETDAARYFSKDEFEAISESVEPWSRWMVRRKFAGRVTLIERAMDNPFAAAFL
jgi:ADP-ribose pyrophosphatase YjhB (NUDIX family)